MSKIKRAWAVLSVTAVMVVSMGLTALATSHNSDLETAISGAADDVTANIGAVLPTVIGVAAFLLVISVAWKFFRRFVR